MPCTISGSSAPSRLAFDAALARRGLPPLRGCHPRARTSVRRAGLTALQETQARRNALSKQVGEGRRRGEDTAALEAEATALRADRWRRTGARRCARWTRDIKAMLDGLPNILDADVPDGPDESANVVLKQWGEPRDLGFQPKQHFELGEALGMMDFATAAKIAGARFTILRGPLARLERALGQFMLDLHTREHGYEETIVPLLVNDGAVLRHRPVAEIRGGSVQDHRRPLPRSRPPRCR